MAGGEARSGVEVMCDVFFFLGGSGQDARAEQDCSALLCGGVVLQVETGLDSLEEERLDKKRASKFQNGRCTMQGSQDPVCVNPKIQRAAADDDSPGSIELPMGQSSVHFLLDVLSEKGEVARRQRAAAVSVGVGDPRRTPYLWEMFPRDSSGAGRCVYLRRTRTTMRPIARPGGGRWSGLGRHVCFEVLVAD